MERAVVFVDGNNWYHALKRAGCTGLGWLNYAKVAKKLLGARDLIGARYYVGRVQQTGPSRQSARNGYGRGREGR